MLLLNEHGLKDIYPLCVEVIYPKLCNTYVSEHEKMARLSSENSASPSHVKCGMCTVNFSESLAVFIQLFGQVWAVLYMKLN